MAWRSCAQSGPVSPPKREKADLLGLKENIIIGHLIPAGSGICRYAEIDMSLSCHSVSPSEVDATAT